MRRLLFIITIMLAGMVHVAEAQETARDRIARRQAQQQKKGLPQLSIRAENMNQSQTQDISNVPWMREIYRFLDLNKDKNASLYYPEYPIGDRMSLFTMMFKLLESGDISAYEYLPNGQEIFTDQYKLNFKDLLTRFSIMSKEENGVISVDESDIPSNEILGYFVKEAWYFDQTNSVVDVKILAICPVMMRQDDFDAESTRYPLFWMPYENVRPYAARMPIMTSNLNNASRQTVDDYFRKRSYDGDIFKTTNMRNRTLAESFPTDSLLKKEQRKIEDQLKAFNKNLWVLNDSVQAATAAAATGKAGKEASGQKSKDNQLVPVRDNEKKASTPKVGKPKSSSPARSMRNRRK